MALALLFYEVDSEEDESKTEAIKSHQWDSGNEVIDGLRNYFYVDTFDASKILIFYIIWNVVSSQLNKLHQTCNNPVMKSKRVSECVWRCVYQAIMVTYGMHKIFSAPENLVLKPQLAWQSWGDSEQLTDCMQLYFLMQLSFHIYSVTYLLKEAKKEYHAYSFLTLHTLQFIMLSLFYILHYYQVGLLVCLFYDTPALAVEVTRINAYLEKITSLFKYLSYLSFTMYTTLWLCNTLYMYPTKVLYFGVISTMDRVDRPLVETVTFGLILLQLYNLYWLLVLLQWMKKMLKPKRKDYFVVYCFFHKRGTLKCRTTEPTISELEKARTDGKTLVQTIKCVIRLKRKLRRIREKKGELNIPDQESFEVEMEPSDSLTIDFVGNKDSDEKSVDDAGKDPEGKTDEQSQDTRIDGEKKGSSDDMLRYASFTSGEESRSSSDLSMKEM